MWREVWNIERLYFVVIKIKIRFEKNMHSVVIFLSCNYESSYLGTAVDQSLKKSRC
jgi:hypothetical protein